LSGENWQLAVCSCQQKKSKLTICNELYLPIAYYLIANYQIMITIPKLNHTDSNNFFLIAGPCAIEGRDMAMEIAERIVKLSDKYKIPYIFKGSYKKANRTKLDSFTGIGDEKALEILKEVGQKFNIPTVTDIHESEEAAMAAKYVDVLQIPAFLCRQTDLLVAAAKTGKVVNVKKGQFLSGQSMRFAVEKIQSLGNPNVILTDRGNSFGYSDLVVDYRNIPEMKATGAPVVMDCTHSLQQPNQSSGVTGGKPALIETIAKAAIAVGADGIFIETHPNPSVAKSDGANMLQLDLLEALLEKLVRVRKAVV
jgi:2-dehydro-3-deoxyphosphooctonate aldolase (KDO 8-P synthase)